MNMKFLKKLFRREHSHESHVHENEGGEHHHNHRRAKLKKWLSRLGFIAVVAFLVGAIITVGAFAWYSKDLPDHNKLIERNVAQSTKIYDRTGKTLLYDVHGAEKRTLLKFEEIPEVVKQATIATEDRYFYEHHGFNLLAMFKGVIIDPLLGRGQRGGSTLTQQFVKNAILTDEKTISRKIKEFILSYRIEKIFTKDQILQMYLNEIPYGSVSYGIQSAAQTYFNKDAKDLTLAEAAILAGIPKAPTFYSPYGNHVDRLMARQQYILGQMAEMGYITQEQADSAAREEIKFAKKQESIIAPHFVMYVKEVLSEQFGEEMVESGGLKVITTLDLEKQQIAEEAVTNGVQKRGKQYGFNNAALYSIDPKTGQIVAMVGSKDYFGKSEPEGCVSGKNCKFEPNDNVILRLRQPGSSIKPLVYAAAFQKGYTPNTILYDVDTTFKTSDGRDYNPKNYDFSQHGPVTMRQALAGSLNIPAVKTLYLVGVQKALDFFELMGYTSFEDRSRFGLAIVLGGGEVRMTEHASAFGIFADQGKYHKPTTILKVENSKGEVLLEFEDKPRQVIDANLANIMSNVLSDNNARAYVFGTQNNLVIGRPVAAKTGTTNEFKDAWTMGYTPSLLTGVWVGNNDSSVMKRGADGSVVAAPIWNEYMRKALAKTPVQNFPAPKIDATGKPVLDGVKAEEKIVKIDKYSKKLATELTPASYVEEKTYKSAHNILYYVYKDQPRGAVPTNPAQADPAYSAWESGVQAWLTKEAEKNGEGIVLNEEPPTEYDDVHVEANRPQIAILSPVNGANISSNFLSMSVTALASRGVSRVEYYLDDQLVGTSNVSPYNVIYSLSGSFGKGYHTLRAIAYDDIDNSNEARVEINLVAEAVAPGVSLISPGSGNIIRVEDFPIPVGVLLTDYLTTEYINYNYRNLDSSKVMTFATIFSPVKKVNYVNWTYRNEEPGKYEVFAEIKSRGQMYQSNSIKVTLK